MKASLQQLLVGNPAGISSFLNLEASTLEALVAPGDTVAPEQAQAATQSLAPFYRGAVLRFNFKLIFNEPVAEGCAVAIFAAHSTNRPFNLQEKESFLRSRARMVYNLVSPTLSRSPVLSKLLPTVTPAWLRENRLEFSLNPKYKQLLAKLPEFPIVTGSESGEEAKSLDMALETPGALPEIGSARIFRKESSYSLTTSSQQKLRKDGVPKEIIDGLEYVVDQVYRGEENFLRVIRTVLKNAAPNYAASEALKPYEEKIIRAAEKTFDSALYEKFFLEKDKLSYSAALNLNSEGFNMAFPGNEAIWVSVKPRDGAGASLALQLPKFCFDNMVYLRAEPCYLHVALDDAENQKGYEKTIEFARSDKRPLKIALDPRGEEYPFLNVELVSDRALVKIDSKTPPRRLLKKPLMLSFIDQLSNKRLSIPVPLIIEAKRSRKARRNLRR